VSGHDERSEKNEVTSDDSALKLKTNKKRIENGFIIKVTKSDTK